MGNNYIKMMIKREKNHETLVLKMQGVLDVYFLIWALKPFQDPAF